MRRALFLFAFVTGCSQPSSAPEGAGIGASQGSVTAAAPLAIGTPPATASATPAGTAGSAASGAASSAGDGEAGSAAGGRAECPGGMTLVPGGVFEMGTNGQDEESPKHRVAVRSFCLGTTEVTVDVYHRCQAENRCGKGHQGRFLCNGEHKDRDDHPINCIDWSEARALCTYGGGRMPTEREWEYAARGGAEQRGYPWGSDPPDGKACYSHEGTCKVGSYPAGAFGLFDMGGNVWEWTASSFGPYPAEAPDGPLKVYRGGSFSRRFPKWLRNGLRNRFRAEEWGAHLGVRCAADLAGASCPAGSHATEGGCEPEGAVAASAVAPTSARPAARTGGDPAAPAASSKPDSPRNSDPLTRTRDPRFDADCLRWKPGRPVCYALRGGSFAERQQAKGSCVNRDVGVGFNSVCCAE